MDSYLITCENNKLHHSIAFKVTSGFFKWSHSKQSAEFKAKELAELGKRAHENVDVTSLLQDELENNLENNLHDLNQFHD